MGETQENDNGGRIPVAQLTLLPLYHRQTIPAEYKV